MQIISSFINTDVVYLFLMVQDLRKKKIEVVGRSKINIKNSFHNYVSLLINTTFSAPSKYMIISCYIFKNFGYYLLPIMNLKKWVYSY